MDRMMFLAMSGARQVMLKQSSNSHNLANLNTTGFKAEIDGFKAMPVYGPGQPVRVYGEDHRLGVDQTPGQLVNTGMPLDIAVNGAGFIAVQDVDGSEAYSRNGNLKVTEQGLLVNSAGYPVLGEGGPITVSPYEDVMIGSDGTISIRPLGQGAAALVELDRIKLVNPDAATLQRNPRGLFNSPDGVEPANAEVRLATESLESSNVNSVQALVTMIELSRQFETQVKMMNAAKDNDAAASQLVKPG